MPRKPQPATETHRILIVDDQPETLVSVRHLLEQQGHTVLTAASGAAALDLLREHEVDLLLVDYFMPEMSGEELVRAVRRFDPYVQIVLQTGYAGEKPAAQMIAELDIQGYHDKADGPDKLLLWIQAGLRTHRLISALRARERVQQELVANVSHELRTPLHVIGGYTELLLDGGFGPLPPGARDALRRVAAAGDSLGRMVADLLSYAKAEAGTIEPAPQWVATDELAAELARLAGMLLEQREVEFTVDLTAAPTVLRADLVKLRTILRNLVTNAVKFTASGSIALRIAATADGVQFTVRDTGIGIAADHHALIFEPFRQLDASITRRYRGVGLGLALARKLARTMAGDIELESEPGVGSSFTLRLPTAAADPARADVAAGARQRAA